MSEKSRDVIPRVANFVFLAAGRNVVSPIGKILSTPANVRLPSRNPKGADIQFAAKWTHPYYVMLHLTRWSCPRYSWCGTAPLFVSGIRRSSGRVGGCYMNWSSGCPFCSLDCYRICDVQHRRDPFCGLPLRACISELL